MARRVETLGSSMKTHRLLVPSFLLSALLSSACSAPPVTAVDPDGGAPVDAHVTVDAPPVDAPVVSDVPPADVPPADAPPPSPRDVRVPDRAVVAWMGVTSVGPWWVEERIAPQPLVAGDRDLGPRSVVRAAPDREVVWTPPDSDRLTSAALHPSGEWSAAGVEADGRIFLAHGDARGLHDRRVLDDPALAADTRAWLSTLREVPRIGALSEASVALVADGEDVVVSLMSQDFAVLVYRWRREGGGFVRGPRTLVSPAMTVTPFLPIGGSYDDFDAVVSPYLTRLGVDRQGRAYVAVFTDRSRLTRHNAAFGTRLELVRERLTPRENSSDALVARVDRDGAVGFTRVVGTADVEDEVFGIAVGDERVAVLGRSRRELGRDNTEIHVMVSELGLDGTPLGTTTFDARDSGLAQAAAYVGPDLLVGGTDAWVQNPSGRSVFQAGRPMLLRLRGAPARQVERLDALLPTTSGHAELRALFVSGGSLLLGGHERGPLTHTGDADRSLVRSDAWWNLRPLP